jgi:dolichol-phosphate mannosyltransferase
MRVRQHRRPASAGEERPRGRVPGRLRGRTPARLRRDRRDGRRPVHDPYALPALLNAVAEGADLVIGSRYVPGGAISDWTLHRRTLSRFGSRYASFVLGLGVTDATSGFRAFRADTLTAAGYATTRANGYAFQIDLAYQVARRDGAVVEVPIGFDQRARGRSKMSPTIAVEATALVTWWGVRVRCSDAARTDVPYRSPEPQAR